MSSIPFFLADAETQKILASWRITEPATLERLIIFAAIALVTVLLVLWAVFVRKRRRRRTRHDAPQNFSRPAAVPRVAKGNTAPTPTGRRRHRRRSGRRHRPRNPTLAETGGLPPVRPESPPEPQA